MESLQERLMRVLTFAHLRSAQDDAYVPHQAALARAVAATTGPAIARLAR
jgi:hypothetical protein